MNIDLRSDILTKPTPEMRKAMAEAVVGDVVFDEDPTVNKLQEIAATKFGKEAGLFMPTGTMGNLTSILVHCNMRGNEIYVGEESHVYNWEQGGVAQLGGVFVKGIRTFPDGTLDLNDIRSKYRSGDNVHHCSGRLIVLENTADGRIIKPEYFAKVRELANELGLKIHLDGARIANAVSELKCDVKEFMQHVDSASVCMSKGLCSPVGSVIVGTREFITAARRVRKSLGGGMRQAGVLAAAGIISLTVMWDRVHEDHVHAIRLAKEISKFETLFEIDHSTVQTNMTVWKVKKSAGFDAAQFVSKMAEPTDSNPTTVTLIPIKFDTVRAVFYHTITCEDVDHVIKKFQDVCKALLKDVNNI